MGKKLLALGLTVAVGLGSLVGCKMNEYEKKIIYYGDEKCTKVIHWSGQYGNRAYSSFEICNTNEEYHQFNYFKGDKSILIRDGGYGWKRDGLVDYLSVKINKENLTLIRERDYPKYKKALDKANEFLAEKREEFKNHY